MLIRNITIKQDAADWNNIRLGRNGQDERAAESKEKCAFHAFLYRVGTGFSRDLLSKKNRLILGSWRWSLVADLGKVATQQLMARHAARLRLGNLVNSTGMADHEKNCLTNRQFSKPDFELSQASFETSKFRRACAYLTMALGLAGGKFARAEDEKPQATNTTLASLFDQVDSYREGVTKEDVRAYLLNLDKTNYLVPDEVQFTPTAIVNNPLVRQKFVHSPLLYPASDVTDSRTGLVRPKDGLGPTVIVAGPKPTFDPEHPGPTYQSSFQIDRKLLVTAVADRIVKQALDVGIEGLGLIDIGGAPAGLPPRRGNFLPNDSLSRMNIYRGFGVTPLPQILHPEIVPERDWPPGAQVMVYDGTINEAVDSIRSAVRDQLDAVTSKNPVTRSQHNGYLVDGLVHTEMCRLSGLLYVLHCACDGSAVLNHSSKLQDLDASVASCEEKLVQKVTSVIEASIGLAPQEPPALLLREDVNINFKVVQRELSFASGKYKEVVTLISDQGEGETFTWVGDIPLSLNALLRSHPYCLDITGQSLALREIGLLAAKGRSGHLPLDYAVANPYLVIPELQVALVERNIARKEVEKRILDLGEGLFAQDWSTIEKLCELEKLAPEYIPPRFDIRRVLPDDEFAKKIEELQAPKKAYLGAIATKIAANKAIGYLSTLPDSFRVWVQRYYPPSGPGQMGGTGYSEETQYNILKSSCMKAAQDALNQAEDVIWKQGHQEVLLRGPTLGNAGLSAVYLNHDCTRYVAQYSVSRFGSFVVEGETGELASHIVKALEKDPSFLYRAHPDFAGVTEVGLSYFAECYRDLFGENDAVKNAHVQGLSYHGLTPGDLMVSTGINIDPAKSLDFIENYPAVALANKVSHLPWDLSQTIRSGKEKFEKVRPEAVMPVLTRWKELRKEAEAVGTRNGDEQVAKIREKAERKEWSIGFGITLGGPVPIPSLSFSYGDFGITISTDFRSGVDISPTLSNIPVFKLGLEFLKSVTSPQMNVPALEVNPFQKGFEFDFSKLPKRDAELPKPKSINPQSSTSGGPPAPDAGSVSASEVFLKAKNSGTAAIAASTELLTSAWTHDEMLRMDRDGAWISDPVQDALNKRGSSLQGLNKGVGELKYDSYFLTIKKLPPGVTIEQIFESFGENPTGTVGTNTFKFWANFEKDRVNTPGPTRVGTIFDIDVPGPFNAPVIVVSKTRNNLTVHTLEGHPVTGSRTFGWEQNVDGSYTIYTRGITKINDRIQFTLPPSEAVRAPMSFTWSAWMSGLKEQVKKMGGETSEQCSIPLPPIQMDPGKKMIP